MAESSDTKDVDDLCLCGRGKLHEGITGLRIQGPGHSAGHKECACQGLRPLRRSLYLAGNIQADRRDHVKVSRRKTGGETHSLPVRSI